ncbi:hypothetical protein [Paraburkholderia sp. J41]|uniref:hypothetical protein n=1 Tax=Paraburkholderia sp. J41 TaxID=2805433 RepID=UPI002AC3381A|nr:hypothetical protein [Paraburkholderia sp. J41]
MLSGDDMRARGNGLADEGRTAHGRSEKPLIGAEAAAAGLARGSGARTRRAAADAAHGGAVMICIRRAPCEPFCMSGERGGLTREPARTARGFAANSLRF